MKETQKNEWEEVFDLLYAPLNMGYDPARASHENIRSFIREEKRKSYEEGYRDKALFEERMGGTREYGTN